MPPSPKKQTRWHLVLSGQVQHVGFRHRAMYLARELDITGWAKNLPDGRVEMEAQGNLSDLRRLLLRLKGQRFIRIRSVVIQELPLQEEHRFFVAD